jgi:hypothetical protein
MERSGDNVGGGDARTLSFAAYRIDAALLDQLLLYEGTLLAELRQGWSPAAMASAHRLALASSGLSQEIVERALAVLRRFAGNRQVARRLRERSGSVDPERADDLQQRLATLDRELRERDDPDTIALLLQHEDTLLDLHRRLAHVLGP